MEAWLHEVSHPATLAQVVAHQRWGLRARVLTLPVLVAFVVSLIGRQRGSVSAAVRVLRAAGLLRAGPTAVSQQAMSLRLRCCPPARFERALLALDGCTLDAVLHQTGLLRDQPGGPLGGRSAAVLDVCGMLPRQVRYEADRRANDPRCWDRALTQLPAGCLVWFDGGGRNDAQDDDLGARGVAFLTRAGTKMAERVTQVQQQPPPLRDRRVAVGSHPQRRCTRPLRRSEVQCGRSW